MSLANEPGPAVRLRLAEERNVWLCTVRPDGSAHVTPVWFVYQSSRWWIGSDHRSVKARNIRTEARVSLALEDGRFPVVAEGHATLIHDRFPREVVAAFERKLRVGRNRFHQPHKQAGTAGSTGTPLAHGRHRPVTTAAGTPSSPQPIPTEHRLRGQRREKCAALRFAAPVHALAAASHKPVVLTTRQQRPRATARNSSAFTGEAVPDVSSTDRHNVIPRGAGSPMESLQPRPQGDAAGNGPGLREASRSVTSMLRTRPTKP
jgi:hypothetical protein